ncbi:helix-turn-helix domain-containing protein [Altericista sp. CCNU0014]|uniref:helix-turn-helix domain-containing protein n=1 Tax=Altericista sp. CCNU0014 TaxID=3082949 RepID=UPI00384E104D
MTTTNTISWDSVRAEILAKPAVKAEYDALETEFDVARHVIALRKATGLNQRDFADRVGIKQPQLARIESGKQMPKLETLMKLAAGAGYAIEVHFVSADESSVPKIDPLHIPSKPLAHA